MKPAGVVSLVVLYCFIKMSTEFISLFLEVGWKSASLIMSEATYEAQASGR